MQGDKEAVIVNVIKGSGLPAHDKNGLSDPYICMDLETGTPSPSPKRKDFKHHTGTVKKSLDPQWGEVFSFASSDVDELLRFYVFDYNWVHSDVFLCVGEVPLRDVQDAGGYLHEHEINLSLPDGQDAGKLVASITYGKPDKEVPPPQLYSRREQKIAAAKAKGAARIDKRPPKAQVSAEAIEIAREMGLDGKQVDRAYKYFCQTDSSGTGKITFADYAALQKKAIRRKRDIGLMITAEGMSTFLDNKNHAAFDLADENKDGFLTFEEFLTLWRSMEVELLGTSWNPIKNKINEFHVMQQAMSDGRSGNVGAMYPGMGGAPKMRRK